MNLNEQIPGLPVWPYIWTSDEREYVVHGRHTTYQGYIQAKWAYIALIIAGGCAMWKVAPFVVTQVGDYALVAGGYSLLCILGFVFSAPRRMAYHWFGADLPVRIVPEGVYLRGRFYDCRSGVLVQFRSSRPYLSEQEQQQLMDRCKGKPGPLERHEFEFRQIEMIHGDRVVYITSVDDIDKAAQYARALQRAFEFSRPKKSASEHSLFRFPSE